MHDVRQGEVERHNVESAAVCGGIPCSTKSKAKFALCTLDRTALARDQR